MMKTMKWIMYAGAAMAAVLFLPLCIGIWLPDVLLSTPRTLAAVALPSGEAFRVIQYWNHCDFYNTELIHTSVDGTTATNVLDGDDSKTWSVPMTVNEASKTVAVTLGGNRKQVVSWGKEMPNQPSQPIAGKPGSG
jgi:hypothetical protein